MIEQHGKYMVNFIGQDRWYGEYFDTQELAIAEARRALICREHDSDIFGEPLEDYTLENMGVDAYEQTHFLIGKVDGLTVPDNLGQRVIEWLDERYWWEQTYEDDIPSQYVVSSEDVQELNELLKDWLMPKVKASNYYVVRVLGEVEVGELEDLEEDEKMSKNNKNNNNTESLPITDAKYYEQRAREFYHELYSKVDKDSYEEYTLTKKDNILTLDLTVGGHSLTVYDADSPLGVFRVTNRGTVTIYNNNIQSFFDEQVDKAIVEDWLSYIRQYEEG